MFENRIKALPRQLVIDEDAQFSLMMSTGRVASNEHIQRPLNTTFANTHTQFPKTQSTLPLNRQSVRLAEVPRHKLIVLAKNRVVK